MSKDAVLEQDKLMQDIQAQMIEQAKAVELGTAARHSDEEQTRRTLRDEIEISNKILISISENINIMAIAINKSEAQKQKEREGYVKFFKWLLVALVGIAAILIFADTFFGYRVRLEFLISVIVAILADIFAIVHTIVKYMTNVEHYDAYNKLIDSLLKHINYGHENKKDT